MRDKKTTTVLLFVKSCKQHYTYFTEKPVNINLMKILRNESCQSLILHKYSNLSSNIKEYNYWGEIFFIKNFKRKRLKF